MAARFSLSSPLAALALGVMLAAVGTPAPAQQPAPPPDRQSDQPLDPDAVPDGLTEDACARLPGGNAPIQRLARIEGGMSVRNLELTYLDKPLHQLGEEDIEYLRELWPFCETFEEPVANSVADRLEILIDDARAARQASLVWISEVEARIAELAPGEASIRTIHDLWQQMLNREFEMLPSDLHYLADMLSAKRDELYRAREDRQRTLIRPFDPGPPETRDIRD